MGRMICHTMGRWSVHLEYIYIYTYPIDPNPNWIILLLPYKRKAYIFRDIQWYSGDVTPSQLVTGPWFLQVSNNMTRVKRFIEIYNKSADPGHQQGGARQRKSTTSSTTTPAPAPAPSEHKARRSGTCSFARAEAKAVEAAIEAPGLSFRENSTIVLQVGHRVRMHAPWRKWSCLPQPPLRRCSTRPVLTVFVIMPLQKGHVYSWIDTGSLGCKIVQRRQAQCRMRRGQIVACFLHSHYLNFTSNFF